MVAAFMLLSVTAQTKVCYHLRVCPKFVLTALYFDGFGQVRVIFAIGKEKRKSGEIGHGKHPSLKAKAHGKRSKIVVIVGNEIRARSLRELFKELCR